MDAHTHPRLLADIGSRYARFALEGPAGQLERAAQLRCEDYPDFISALRAYLTQVRDVSVRHGAVAIANPVEGDQVRMTNYHWQFSIEETRVQAGLDTLVVVNDFTALAVAVSHVDEHQRRQVGGGHPRSQSVMGVLGAGSGLGVSALIPADDGWISLGSEGGHVALSPADAKEAQLLAWCWQHHPHVSAERLLSASGLELLHRGLCELAGEVPEPLSSQDITARGLAEPASRCREVLDTFCALLGTAAANLAVTLGAFGGIYIGGRIVPALGTYFDTSPFRSRFEAKGRFSAYVAQIPTYVITAEEATLIGLSAILDNQLRKRSSQVGMLDRIRQALPEFSPAERRVAEQVLSRPRSVLSDPIAEIARTAEVSQPTVIRFCRSLGCEGLSDFKLKLASSLTGTIPVSHTQVMRTDTSLELSAKVLGNTAGAILQARDQISRKAIDEAIETLVQARRVECFATGHYGIVAMDAQYKFLRLGVPAGTYTEPRLQSMAAGVMQAGDVMLVLSSSGRIPELLQAVEMAQSRGAKVIALAPHQSPLAKRADVVIAIEHTEDIHTQLPMVSRVLFLVVVDILTVGLALRKGLSADPSVSGDAEQVLSHVRQAAH